MRRLLRHRPSPAMIVACIALMFAMGGTGYAAIKLPKNSVGSKQIRKNAVSASKVKNRSLLAEDFAAGQLPAGPQGPQGNTGATGPQGPAGTARAYARVDENAGRTLQPDVPGFPAQNKGIVQANVVPGEGGAATGTTCFDLPFRPASAEVSIDNADAGTNVDRIASVAIDRGEDLGDCPASHNDARVRIIDTDLTAGGAEQDPGPANARFFIWFEA